MSKEEGYELTINGRGRIPPPLRTTAPGISRALLRNRTVGKLRPHTRIGYYDPSAETLTVRIDDEAFPEFWCEVDLKREDLEGALPDPRPNKKRKRQGTEEWNGATADGVNRPSLEGQFIAWKQLTNTTDWMTFEDCRFVTDLGEFKKGDTVSKVGLSRKRSVMRVHRQDATHVDFSVHLVLKHLD